MRSLQVPSWLSAGVLERYHAGASHLFLLHGNVRDLHPFGDDWVPLVEGLKRLTRRREVVVTYDVSSGLAFPDAEREKALRKALGLRGVLPADPARALVVLDALLTTERCPSGSVAVVIDYAPALAPAGPSGGAERQNVTTLARWASDPRVAARRPLVFLIAPSPQEVSDEVYAGASGAEVVPAPMGIILMGPPGTGKSYLAECFAKECGMLCVRFRPLRQMYVGQSERNQEKAFAAIRALAPVVVMVDESDQAEGGSRDQGSGDSGVTERMRASAFNFWGDSALRAASCASTSRTASTSSTPPCGVREIGRAHV